MKNLYLQRAKKALFLLLALGVAAILAFSFTAEKSVYTARKAGTVSVLKNIQKNEREDVLAPTGTVIEYRFSLNRVAPENMLAFYTNHHNAEVYLNGECVYRVAKKSSLFQTGGAVWVKVPLQVKDSGQAVCVRLYPLYENYRETGPEFFCGSEYAVFQTVLCSALPELLLCFLVVLTGFLLLAVAFYTTVKRATVMHIYAIGLLALFTGIWRFTYGSLAYWIFENKAVFIYNLSVLSLTVIALSMLSCVETNPKKPVQKKVLGAASAVYAGLYSVQFVLQLFGILDLRQMLTVTHITLALSAVLLFVSGLNAWLQSGRRGAKLLVRNYSWLIGVGVVLDLALYYFSKTSAGMLLTLGAILAISLFEGARFIQKLMQQKNALAEMQTQLTLTRTTTMMSQIRSHFVFNILNAISGMCKYDPEQADETVVRFARYLRSNIDIMENDSNIPFTTDLKQLEDYVALEQVRFGEKLAFQTDIQVTNFFIPPLILQPVVENAIKHGVRQKLSGGTIILRTRETKNKILITVEDDGVGFDLTELEKSTSVGLRNIRFRLKHLVNGELEIKSTVGVGTTVTVIIPKEEGMQ